MAVESRVYHVPANLPCPFILSSYQLSFACCRLYFGIVCVPVLGAQVGGRQLRVQASERPAAPLAARASCASSPSCGATCGPTAARIAAALAALVVAAACFLVIGQGLKRVVDAGFAQGDPAALNQGLFALLAVIVVMSASVWARFYLVSWLGERVVADLRRDVFAHLLELSPAFFEQARTGEVISRLTTDTALLEQVVGTSVSMAVRNTLLGVGSLVMLALTSLKLTALVLLMVPVVIVPIALFGRRVRKLSRASQDRVADLGSYVDETLHEIRTVQAYGHERDRSPPVRPAGRGGVRHGAQPHPAARHAGVAVIVLVFGGIGIILWIGGHDVLAGRLTAGELSAFVFYAAMVAAAAGRHQRGHRATCSAARAPPSG